MYISLANSRTHEFKKWADTHWPGNDDYDNSGGATPIALTELPCDGCETINLENAVCRGRWERRY